MARATVYAPRSSHHIVGVSFSLVLTATAHSDVTLFSGLDSFGSWASAVGSYTTIAFNDLPVNTWVTDQYASSGVIFNSDDPDVVLGPSGFSFPLDMWGVNGVHHTALEFPAPKYAFAYHHQGKHEISLYFEGEAIYVSPPLGGSGFSFFDALVSTKPFDRLEIVPWDDPSGVIYIDNIYFSSIPTPPAFIALLVGGLSSSRRRRDRDTT